MLLDRVDYMAKNAPENNEAAFNCYLPARLVAEFDQAVEEKGLIKKRAIAAAAAAFLRASVEEQMKLYREVYDLYYKPSE